MVRNFEGPTRDRTMRPRLLKRIAQKVVKCKFNDKDGKWKSSAILSNYAQNSKSQHTNLKLWKNKTKWMYTDASGTSNPISACNRGI